MKTSQLVGLLAQDRTWLPSPGRLLARLFVPAGLLALLAFLVLVRVRPDLLVAVQTLRFNFKLLLNLAVWLCATGLLLRQARPAAGSGAWSVALWAVPAALLIGVCAEMLVLPREQWWVAAQGRNATWCLRIIPALAIVPLLAALAALRRAAPAHPARAGAVAGLMSAGLAGSLYALHCPDDSPLFVGIWYLLATGFMAALGGALGARLLRW